MKLSFVSTVFNEEKSIEKFIESLLSQSRLPDEIIIIDGGSTDTTINLLENKLKNFKGTIKILSKNGNRSVGRNEGIIKSTGEIIAVSDAGCVLDKNWFKNITSPFINKNIDVVSGYYLPVSRNVFEKSLATYTSVMPDRIDPDNFLPSSRSIAFRKSAWEKAGGYPENLDTCEDLVFAKKMMNVGLKFKFEKNAIVHWRQRENLKDAFFQFLGYAIGDGKARFFRSTTPLLYIRYIIGVVLLFWFFRSGNTQIFLLLIFSLLMYIFWSISKNYKYVEDIKAVVILPILQFTADFAVLIGTTYGFINSIWDTQNKH